MGQPSAWKRWILRTYMSAETGSEVSLKERWMEAGDLCCEAGYPQDAVRCYREGGANSDDYARKGAELRHKGLPLAAYYFVRAAHGDRDIPPETLVDFGETLFLVGKWSVLLRWYRGDAKMLASFAVSARIMGMDEQIVSTFLAAAMSDDSDLALILQPLISASEPPPEQAAEWNENLFLRIGECVLYPKVKAIAASMGVEFVYELAQKTEDQITGTDGAGRKTLRYIKEDLHDLGLSLNMKLRGFPVHWLS